VPNSLALGSPVRQACRTERSRPQKVPVWVVVRVDGPIDHYDEASLCNRITLVEAFPTREESDAEASRLNELNASKGSVYFSTPTRFFPDGRHVERGY
jgi:hypothetical protein